MPIVSDRIKEVRDWFNLLLTFVTVLIIPAGLLILKNQRLEITADVQRSYVSVETYRNNQSSMAAENAALKSEIATLNAKMDKLQITLVRLTDAVKLRDP